MNEMYRNPELRKAIAFSLYMKSRVVSSSVPHFTINKLHEISGVSATTIKKRLRILRQHNMVSFTGKGGHCIVFNSLRSHTSHRNICIKDIDFIADHCSHKNTNAQNVKFIDDILTALLIIEIQNHKNFAKQMIQQSDQPKGLNELKIAKKACNRFGYSDKFSDNGISYKYMAQKIGCGLQKAFDIVKFATKGQILVKFRNVQKFYFPGAKFIKEELLRIYTYIKGNTAYKVSANRYQLCDGMVFI